MANVLLSVRLSPRLAAVLDRASDYLDFSPSQLVETLLGGSGVYNEEILKIRVEGPFTEKRNLRLRRAAIQQLRRLTGYREGPSGKPFYDVERSTYIRSMLAYFFSKLQAFQSVVPNAPRAEEWARVLEEEERMLRARQTPRIARPGNPRVGILILILPFLVLLTIGILDLLKKDEDTGHEPIPPSREET
ncbi:MAG: hypothetical protein ACE5HC_16705 [Candidatus Binatia bacterium]